MKLSEVEKHLGQFRVGIAGAGGLGSNCAMALARSGIGELVLADNDFVEESNLSRQYFFADQTGMDKVNALKENITRANRKVNVVTHHVRLSRDNIPVIFSGCRVIVEAFDSPGMKEMLIETVQIAMPDVTLVIGSGMAGWGNNNLLRHRKIDDTLHVCGDESTEVTDDLPPMAPRVGIVANMQANAVVEILMSKVRS